jgi:hypothetical protein
MADPTFRLLEARTAAERLGELERFLEYWFGKRRPEYGEPETGLDRLSLPDPLRRFYAFAGRWPSADPEDLPVFYTGSGGHHLRPPDDVRPQPDGKLDFFMEYQGDWVGLTLPTGEDPPVWLSGWLAEGDPDERTVRVCDSLSKFLVTHCLMTILYEMENAPGTVDAREGPLVDRFRGNPGLGDEAVRIWDTSGLDWPDSCLNYRGSFHLIPFSGGILVHRDGDAYHFGALRAGAVTIMVGDILRGPHK